MSDKSLHPYYDTSPAAACHSKGEEREVGLKPPSTPSCLNLSPTPPLLPEPPTHPSCIWTSHLNCRGKVQGVCSASLTYTGGWGSQGCGRGEQGADCAGLPLVATPPLLKSSSPPPGILSTPSCVPLHPRPAEAEGTLLQNAQSRHPPHLQLLPPSLLLLLLFTHWHTKLL